MPSPFKVLISTCLLVAFLATTGVHLVCYQLVAWAEMACAYSQKDGWVEGLRKTFNGENPCSKCLHIKKAHNKFKNSPIQIDFRERIYGLNRPDSFRYQISYLLVEYQLEHFFASLRRDPPPTPIPEFLS